MIKRDQRDLIVFMKYTEVIKSVGKHASSLKKRTLYEETADYFFLEWKTVQKIVLKVLKHFKEGSLNNIFSEMECQNIMIIINQIHSDKNDRDQINSIRERETVQETV